MTRRLIIIIAFILPILSGCVVDSIRFRAKTSTEDIDGINWSSDGPLVAGFNFWRTEARRRFDNPFLFVCHGADYGKCYPHPSNWQACPKIDGMPGLLDEDSIAWTLHSLMPNRDIVFISCNPHKLKLTAPRCWYYPKGNVWSHPYWSTPSKVPCDTAACIWEFVEGGT
jgi:hypothetical protein